jgi:hypothetical protein
VHAPADTTRLQFGARANDEARRALAGRYLLHTLANAPRIAREGDAASLAGLLAGAPAVIAAAGPSLDVNIHDLGPVRGRAVLIACDTAANPLLAAGIEPDFVVASDPSRANAGHLSSLAPARSWLVGEGSLHPSAFVHFDRRTFVFRVSTHEPWPWLEDFGLGRAQLDTWGSVATSALSLALSLGCDPIIFIGADFAFTGDRPYCRGTSLEAMWGAWVGGGATYEGIWRDAVGRWPKADEPDIAGRPARTAPHLVSFRDWIVKKAAAHPARRIVNATGAGILAGPAIVQRNAGHTLWRSAPLDRAAIHARIRQAHASTTGDSGRLFEAIADMTSEGDLRGRVARWIAFTNDAVDPRAIAAALRSPEYAAWTLGRASRGGAETA